MAWLVLHQPAHLVVVVKRDIIPRYLASVAINDANTGIVAGRAENALLVVPIHRDARAANHSKSRSEPTLLPTYSGRAMSLLQH